MKIPFNKPFIAGKELYYIAQAVMVDLTYPVTARLRGAAMNGWRTNWDVPGLS